MEDDRETGGSIHHIEIGEEYLSDPTSDNESVSIDVDNPEGTNTVTVTVYNDRDAELTIVPKGAIVHTSEGTKFTEIESDIDESTKYNRGYDSVFILTEPEK